MADIVLKDRNGEDVTYSGIETVTFDTPTEGEQATFTHGVEMQGVEVELALADGDQQITVPDGYLVKAATIKKPDTLLPENIRNGTTVAGVTGEFIGDTEEATVELSMADGDQTVLPSAEGKVLSKVTIAKPETLIPENIAKDVEIGGVVGTLEGGGSSLPAGLYLSQEFTPPLNYPGTHFVLNGELYYWGATAASTSKTRLYKVTGTTYTQLLEFDCTVSQSRVCPCEYEGKVFFFDQYGSTFAVYNGTAVTSVSAPTSLLGASAFVYNGKLYVKAESNSRGWYCYDENTGNFVTTTDITSTHSASYTFTHNDVVCSITTSAFFVLSNGTFNSVGTMKYATNWAKSGTALYGYNYSNGTLYVYDLVTENGAVTPIYRTEYKTVMLGSYPHMYAYNDKTYLAGGSNTFKMNFALYVLREK